MKNTKKSKPTKQAKQSKAVKITKTTKSQGKDIVSRSIEVVNIVVSTSLEHDVPLEKMAATLSNTEYNPEQFPGLVYKLNAAKATFLLFSNGKIVCTGTKSEEEVHKALDMLIVNLKKVS